MEGRYTRTTRKIKLRHRQEGAPRARALPGRAMSDAVPPAAARSTPHQRRLARRATAKAQRVSEATTAPVSAPRQRERHLPEAAGTQTVLEHNTWDDVVWEESDRLAAERLIAAQTPAPAAVATECTARATDRWDVHYAANPRNYKDRRYLHNEFPQLLEPRRGGGELLVLEIGCGAGNSLLPLLHTNRSARGFACDLAPSSVELVRERLLREGLAHRASAFVWDVARPPPPGTLPAEGFDVILAVFTLSAPHRWLRAPSWAAGVVASASSLGLALGCATHSSLDKPPSRPGPQVAQVGGCRAAVGARPKSLTHSAPSNTQALSPEALPAALAQLHASLRPGGTLLLRDYGRLDLKHLKFAAVPGSRLHSPIAGWDWHTRGDGPAS